MNIDVKKTNKKAITIHDVIEFIETGKFYVSTHYIGCSSCSCAGCEFDDFGCWTFRNLDPKSRVELQQFYL